MIRAALARLFAPSSDRAAPPMRLRRYEGAAGGRRLASAGVMPNSGTGRASSAWTAGVAGTVSRRE